MKKDFLSRVKGAILSKEEAKTISGGYSGSYLPGSQCSFILCNSLGGPAPAKTIIPVAPVSVNCTLPMPGTVYTTNSPGLYCVKYN